ncbi:MAG: cobalt-precorrin 5A hydrolase [Eubacteriales bacterium]|nr:cobalt-precorrin 5A hydrolase [Eubacteriales bacterium]
MNNVAIISFTNNGRELANRLTEFLGCKVFKYEGKEKAQDFLNEKFCCCDTIIFIGAVGIATRMISKLIKSKDVDPAVIVIDELGKYVIPILSGHLGGGNESSIELARLIGAQEVITTATDINKKFAVDIWTKYAGCKIADISKIKVISSAVLRNEKIGIYSGFPFDGVMPDELTLDKTKIGICVSLNDRLSPYEETLNLVPQIITLGVGCRKDMKSEIFEQFILRTLAENNISILSIEKIASIDLKKDEKCILDFSEKYNIPFVTYTAEELNQVEGQFSASEFVKKITGVDNVCERSAVKNSENGAIILSKTCQNGVTIALAKKDWKCKF